DVRPLAVPGRRIVVLPEDLEQGLVGNLLGIEGHLHRFGVPGPARANLLVGRLAHRPARVADGGLDNAGGLAEGFLDAPETTGAEGGSLEGDGLHGRTPFGSFAQRRPGVPTKGRRLATGFGRRSRELGSKFGGVS